MPYAVPCRALGVSQSWFYKWKDGDRSARRARRDRLKAEIARLFAARKGKDGSPRITAALRDAGWAVSKNTVAVLMAEMGLAARRRRPQGHDPAGQGPVAGTGPGPAVVRCGRRQPQVVRRRHRDPPGEGKLHLASVLDMGSRRIVGFGLAEHPDAELSYGALAMAVAVRGGQVPGVIMHTDQGSEYTARRFRQACERLGIRQSMGLPGSALDNAVIESWHSTVEFELRRIEQFPDKAAARAGVAAWIEDYNHDRRHSALGMMSPVAYELALAAKDAA